MRRKSTTSLRRRQINKLNRQIDQGLAELDRGEGIPAGESRRRAWRALRAAARRA